MVVVALRGPDFSESAVLPSEREHYPEMSQVQLVSQSEVSQKDLFGISGMPWPKSKNIGLEQ